MDKVLNITYASSLTDLCEINSSFDSGVLRICYAGENRNRSFISRETLERCLPTIYNCPVVCNYDRESDTFGGHDMEVVRTEDGDLKIVNVTQPVGVIPESSNIWFENFEEDDGTVHEYLCAEVLVWKRQEAYEKIKRDGITAHSMEIGVKSGKNVDGVYHIDDFEFNAFALIGVEPCFEGSSLTMFASFAKQDFKLQFSEMMQELKESFNKVNASKEDDDTHPQKNSMEGGTRILEAKMELVAKYGIDINSLDFSIEELTIEELTEKFEAMRMPEGASEPETQSSSGEEHPEDEKFALTENVVEEIRRVLSEIKIEREWGEGRRYVYIDCDFDLSEVYCWDASDWLLYGFTYTMNGDSISIDFESKKRKKYVIADFDEGEQPSPFAAVFKMMEQKLHDNAEWEAKYQTASDTIMSMETELGELRQFKTDTENAIKEGERDKVFAQFGDLVGVEAFESLRNNCEGYDAETLEEKCFAIRGRNSARATFSYEGKTPKFPVTRTNTENEPYGGIVKKYSTDHN